MTLISELPFLNKEDIFKLVRLAVINLRLLELKKEIRKPTLALFSQHLNVKIKDGIVETYIEKQVDKVNILPSNILSIFAVNQLGKTALPSINYNEANAELLTDNLSHRDYFKKVRDKKAWTLKLTPSKSIKNVYIQRLYNLHNGSRGTTISMPLYNEQLKKDQTPYVIGADIILPSVEMREPSKKDFTYMVINRNSGEVLFHSDESRTMVENLFYAGNNQAQITQWIKAGLDAQKSISEPIKGNYHGKTGRFFVKKNIVDSWATVVFYPDDSLNAIMTSQFMYLLVSFILFTLLILLLVYLNKKITLLNFPRSENDLFPAYYERLFLLRGSIFCTAFFSVYFLFFITGKSLLLTDNLSIYLFLILILITSLLFYLYQNWFIKKTNRFIQEKIQIKKLLSFNCPAAFKSLVLCTFVLIFVQLLYLNSTVKVPILFLQQHYENQYCNEFNVKKEELNNTALRLFPNSVTEHNFTAADLLTTHGEWLEYSGKCTDKLTEVLPEDYPSLSTVAGVENLWQWAKSFFKGVDTSADINQLKRAPGDLLIYLLFILIFIVMILWNVFNKKVLWARLYCSFEFLDHIKHLTNEVHNLKPHINQDTQKLIINCGNVKINGVGLDCLLGIQDSTTHMPPFSKVQNNKLCDDSEDKTIKLFYKLVKASSLLQQFVQKNINLPNVKLVDVRSKAELDWVGRIPGAIEIELRTYPSMQPNPEFMSQFTTQVTSESTVLFICRSGARSSFAAQMATQANYSNCYNVLEGFEGDPDDLHHRGKTSGWKVAGLPWVQG